MRALSLSLSLSLSLDARFKGAELRDFRTMRARERTRNRLIAGTSSNLPYGEQIRRDPTRGRWQGVATSIIATAKWPPCSSIGEGTTGRGGGEGDD